MYKVVPGEGSLSLASWCCGNGSRCLVSPCIKSSTQILYDAWVHVGVQKLLPKLENGCPTGLVTLGWGIEVYVLYSPGSVHSMGILPFSIVCYRSFGCQ